MFPHGNCCHTHKMCTTFSRKTLRLSIFFGPPPPHLAVGIESERENSPNKTFTFPNAGDILPVSSWTIFLRDAFVGCGLRLEFPRVLVPRPVWTRYHHFPSHCFQDEQRQDAPGSYRQCGKGPFQRQGCWEEQSGFFLDKITLDGDAR